MLRGPSGGGKTTLMNILGTIDKPTSGTIGNNDRDQCAPRTPLSELWLDSSTAELLGTPITAKSDDNFLAMLRLEKIGACLFLFLSRGVTTCGPDLVLLVMIRIRVPNLQLAGDNVGVRERRTADDHPRQAQPKTTQEAHARSARLYFLLPSSCWPIEVC